MTEESTRQRLEDEYLFTKDYPAIHQALQEGRTLVACIERVSDREEVCSVSITAMNQIAFVNGHINFAFSKNTLEDFTDTCERIDASFICENLRVSAVKHGDNPFATFCMWAGAITLAIVLASLILAILSITHADLPLFR